MTTYGSYLCNLRPSPIYLTSSVYRNPPPFSYVGLLSPLVRIVVSLFFFPSLPPCCVWNMRALCFGLWVRREIYMTRACGWSTAVGVRLWVFRKKVSAEWSHRQAAALISGCRLWALGFGSHLLLISCDSSSTPSAPSSQLSSADEFMHKYNRHPKTPAPLQPFPSPLATVCDLDRKEP